MGEKVKVATTWLQSCSGCHISLLDLHEELLDVLDLIEIVHSPLMDIKEIPKVTVGDAENHNKDLRNLPGEPSPCSGKGV